MDHSLMASLFRSGKTLAQIGARAGISRERVRQILKKRGITGRDGGYHVAVEQQKEANAKRVEDMMTLTGVSLSAAARVLGINPGPLYEVLDSKTARLQRAITRFWLLVDKTGGPDKCHPWMGKRLPNNYGRISHGNVLSNATKAYLAHRVAFILTHGRQPRADKLFRGVACVLHTCDNPPCCNPAHLKEGSMADNMRDRDERGRDRFSRGYRATRDALGRFVKGPVRPAGFSVSPNTLKKMRKAWQGEKGKARRAKTRAGYIAWWNNLTPEQKETHTKNCAEKAREVIAKDPAAHAAKIRAGRGK